MALLSWLSWEVYAGLARGAASAHLSLSFLHLLFVLIMSTTLILGNGFDLGLGWKTRYVDFYNSKYFPRVGDECSSNLERFIYNEGQDPNWGGVEKSLEKYAILPESCHTFEEDKRFYDELVRRFKLFMADAINAFSEGKPGYSIPEKGTCNFYFINECIGYDRAVDDIVSFNYTSFEDIARCIVNDRLDDLMRVEEAMAKINFSYVHYSNHDKLVLGISNDVVLSDNRYDFLKKSHISMPPSFYGALSKADRIIIWGLSLSKCDRPYFRDFFGRIAASKGDPRTIYIVSKNESSCDDCLFNIESMLGGDMTNLLMKHRIVKVCTDKGNQSEGFSRLLLDLRGREGGSD